MSSTGSFNSYNLQNYGNILRLTVVGYSQFRVFLSRGYVKYGTEMFQNCFVLQSISRVGSRKFSMNGCNFWKSGRGGLRAMIASIVYVMYRCDSWTAERSNLLVPSWTSEFVTPSTSLTLTRWCSFSEAASTRGARLTWSWTGDLQITFNLQYLKSQEDVHKTCPTPCPKIFYELIWKMLPHNWNRHLH